MDQILHSVVEDLMEQIADVVFNEPNTVDDGNALLMASQVEDRDNIVIGINSSTKSVNSSSWADMFDEEEDKGTSFKGD